MNNDVIKSFAKFATRDDLHLGHASYKK